MGVTSCVCGLSRGSSPAQLLLSMWNLPGPGIEPVSPALAGGLLSTISPEKSHTIFYLFELHVLKLFFFTNTGSMYTLIIA